MEKALVMKDVSFSYGEEGFSIKHLNFTLDEGEFVAVLGHNGSGKSTLARLADGLLTADEGEIFVFGQKVGEKNLFEVRKNVGIVFQNPDSQAVCSIVEDDVAFGPENIGMEREKMKQRIDFALKATGLETVRKSALSRLSGGQKQRAAIAGVLALSPRIMILDEATAMLDPRGRREIVEVVKKLNKEEKIAVLLITHFMEEALLCSRAVVMNRGEIVMEGIPSEIFRRHEELLTYNLALPRIGEICKRLRAEGIPAADTLEVDNLAEEIAPYFEQGKGEREKEERKDENAEAEIEARHLSYDYNPKTPFASRALDDVSLTVQKGEFFGIIGETGSGKSTFVKHLVGLLGREKRQKKPKESSLFVAGYNLFDKKTDLFELRKKVGIVFQYPESQLFAETVLEDVSFGYKNFFPKTEKEEIERAAREALSIVGLDPSIASMSPFDLSGGQKRRVAIAGVIVTRPEVLILDEPAAGLDPLGKREVMELLHRLHRSWCKSIIIVSHDMDEIAENCTKVAVFQKGKLYAVSSPRELFERGEKLLSLGLDIPLTAKLCEALKKRGIEIFCDFTVEDFLKQLLKRRVRT